MREAGYVPDRVLYSTARRACETWQLAEAKLGAHPKIVFLRTASTGRPCRVAGPRTLDTGAGRCVADRRAWIQAMRGLTLELASGQAQ